MINRRKSLLLLILSLVFALSSCKYQGHAPPLEYDNLQGVADRLYGEGYYFFEPGEGFVREHFIINASEIILLNKKNNAKYYIYDLTYIDTGDPDSKLIIKMSQAIPHDTETLSIASLSVDIDSEFIFYGEDSEQDFVVYYDKYIDKIRLSFKVSKSENDSGKRYYDIYFTNDKKYNTEEERFETEKALLIEIFKTRYILPKSK